MKKTLLILLMLYGGTVQSQLFPVQVSVQLAPPYSPYLSDYTSPGSQKLMVQIRANDITLADYPFKLRITIAGGGITITTRATMAPQPMTLQGGGIPQLYYGEDLQEYFHPDALDFAGMTRESFEKSARLPEGLYRFTVSVLDYNRGTVVSNTATATAWIMLNDPPILNLPVNFSQVPVQDPTNIFFSWTPRHSGSPNSAFTTAYTFRLVEIWPQGKSAHEAFLTQLPLFETTTSQNQLRYGMREPALIPGRSYGWEVTAHDSEGRDLFRNGGRSEVFTFQYGEALPAPENFQLRWAKPTTLSMRWDAVSFGNDVVKYRLQYRPRRNRNDRQWYETRTQFTQKTLYQLEVNTEYEMRVRAETPLQESAYSPVRVFRTLPAGRDQFVCRDLVTPPPVPRDTRPIFPMQVNDTLHAGGYDVLVRDVVQQDGHYYGSGVAIVPWLNEAKIRVTFEDIKVNDRYWLTTGMVKSVWSSESGFLLDTQTPLQPGMAPEAGNLAITVVAADSLVTIEGAAIASVTKDTASNVVVTTTDGRQQTLAKGKSYAIVDDVGNGYVVDQHAHVAKTTATEARAAARRGDRGYALKVLFAGGAGRFGFDEKQYDALAQYYQPLSDGSYAAWKALSSVEPDALEGHLQAADLDLSHLRFQAGLTPLTPQAVDGETLKFSVRGTIAGMEEELLALYSTSDSVPGKVVGKVNLVTYDPIHYNLEIVPVNSAALPPGMGVDAIAENLNSVFAQAVVQWRVNLSEGITVSLSGDFDTGESAVFSNYTPDMKKVLKAYGRLRTDTYYIFLIAQPRDPDALGYMPRGKQAGFVFVGPHNGSVAELLKTIGHELGHGAFNLAHTFQDHGLPAGTTTNLMDYSSGTVLCKYQWDQIHAPRSRMALFEGGEESAMGNAMLEEYVKGFSLHESYYAVAGGLIPEYLWKSGLVHPTAAGFVDGMWNTIEGAWGIANFLNAWQPNNFSAEALMIRMETWQFVVFLNELVASPDARAQAWNEVKVSFGGYIDETLALDNQALYNQGRLLFDVASLFVGVGELKALLKGQKITVGIVSVLNAIPRNLSKFIFKARQLGLSIVKQADRLLLKDGADQIASVADNILHPELFLDDGEQLLTEGSHTLVKNGEGRIGFLREGEGAVAKVSLNSSDELIDGQDDIWTSLAQTGDSGDLNSVASQAALKPISAKLAAGLKRGWTREKVLGYGKGNYPAPEEYLLKSYIEAHLKEFENGVSFFCPRATIERYGKLLGRFDGVYVLPAYRADGILNRAKGDVAMIEKLLGIPEGHWQGKDLCRVDVRDIKRLDLRMPSGNEEAANTLFSPGGITAGGQIEAVISPIPEGMYNYKQIDL